VQLRVTQQYTHAPCPNKVGPSVAALDAAPTTPLVTDPATRVTDPATFAMRASVERWGCSSTSTPASGGVEPPAGCVGVGCGAIDGGFAK